MAVELLICLIWARELRSQFMSQAELWKQSARIWPARLLCGILRTDIHITAILPLMMSLHWRGPEARSELMVVPAGLPELDTPGWVADDFVRDMPLDYTLLVENLSDPDHGVFAHQTATFDSFAASSAFPMKVTTEPGKAGDKVPPCISGLPHDGIICDYTPHLCCMFNMQQSMLLLLVASCNGLRSRCANWA